MPEHDNPQVSQFAKMIRDKLLRTKDISEAVKEIREFLSGFGALSQSEPALEAARLLIEAEFKIENLHVRSIVRQRSKWYHGPRPGDRNWPLLKSYFLEKKGWSPTAVDSIDSTSSEIVALLDNPAQSQFKSRGLVVGYVQSGKTANMTGVISKGVDAGYNVVVVLAGLTDKLRQQTQRRLELDIVQRSPQHWHRLTTLDIKGDFQVPPHGGLMHHPDRVQLAVVKKNVAPLDKLLRTISATLSVELQRLKMLVIDDECDQASVNSASGELDMTKINQKIREALSIIPAAAYVGYTATPFANVLINPYANRNGELDDLYPKDFITALPLPEGYFGTERLFGKLLADADEEDTGLDVIREVPETDEALIQPRSRKDREHFAPALPASLKEAMLYFLATCAARRARGHADQHMTMLVHTSPYVAMHNRLAGLIVAWLAHNESDLSKGAGPIFEQMREIWNREQNRAGTPEHQETESFDQIAAEIPRVIREIDVPVENGDSEDRIDYTDAAKTYIVVGGTVLARGLTLEGLVVSYYLRNSNQYDTLLQMGRWFGYRFGYEDLPRIWMPKQLQLQFRSLAGIEDEIRRDMSEYRGQPHLTPMDFAIRIRTLPGMAITARNKMRHAVQCDVAYWGKHVQTIRFPRMDKKILLDNWSAASDLIAACESLDLRTEASSEILFEGVPRKTVIQFLRRYQVHESHRDLRSSMLLPFVEGPDDRLDRWNVGIIQSASSTTAPALPLGGVANLGLLTRTRLSGSPLEVADIKALMSRRDILFDCRDGTSPEGDWQQFKTLREASVGARPLLLLYPIDAASKPTGNTKRLPLDAAADIIGCGFVFPGSTDFSGRYVSVRLDGLSADEIDAIEAEELESAEAAGVR